MHHARNSAATFSIEPLNRLEEQNLVTKHNLDYMMNWSLRVYKPKSSQQCNEI